MRIYSHNSISLRATVRKFYLYLISAHANQHVTCFLIICLPIEFTIPCRNFPQLVFNKEMNIVNNTM